MKKIFKDIDKLIMYLNLNKAIKYDIYLSLIYFKIIK